MVEGNRERINFKFYKWIWNDPKDKRPDIIMMLKELENEKKVIHLKSINETQTYIACL